jgi:hypothetical protein
LLKGPETWDTWYRSLKIAAQSYLVWDQLKPEEPNPLIAAHIPGTLPNTSTTNTISITPLETPTTTGGSGEQEPSQIPATAIRDPVQNSRHIAAIYTWMQSTVDPLLWSTAVLHDTPQEILRYLMEHCQPSAEEREELYQAKYLRMTTQGPKNQELETYNLEFARLVIEGKETTTYSFTQEKWAKVYVRSLYATHPNLYALLTPMVAGSTTVKFLQLLTISRQLARESGVGKPQRRGAYNASFATLRATNSDNSSPSSSNSGPLSCNICKEPHIFRNCPYINESMRPADWSPKAEIEKSIIERKKTQPKFEERCKKALKPPRRSNNTPSNSSESNDPVSLTAIVEQQVISTGSASKLDRRAWIVDSGSNAHVCNDRNRFIEMRPYQDSLSTGGGTTPITHIGTVVLSVETINGSYREIPVSNCLYSPSVPLNLLSLSLLREKGLFFSQDMQWLSTARTPHFIRLQLYQPDKEIYSLMTIENVMPLTELI